MAPIGGVPVLKFSHDGEVSQLVVQTVNFLRCGCTYVQWLVGSTTFGNIVGDESVTRTMDEIQDILTDLQIQGEEIFRFTHNSSLKKGSVLNFKRMTPQP